MAGDERTLATWLASLDDNALADLFTRRGVSPAASWRDFFDAAEALLDPASIDRALARLDRRELTALVAATSLTVGAALLQVAKLCEGAHELGLLEHDSQDR